MISLSLTVVRSPITIHESLNVEVVLKNGGASPVSLPGNCDRSDAWSVHVFDRRGERVAVASGTPERMMMIDDDPRPKAPLIQELPPGGTWERVIDLGRAVGPLPAGEYDVEAAYEYAPAGVKLRTGRRVVTVLDAPLERITFVRDNCILDGLNVVIEADADGETRRYLRLHNGGRPLGAWYMRPLDADGAEAVVCAYNGFYRRDTYDHFYSRWVVSVRDGMLQAQRYDDGFATTVTRTAPLPWTNHVLSAAFHDGADGLYVLSVVPGGAVACHRLDDGSTEQVFVHGSAFHVDRPGSIVVDDEHIHIVVPSREVVYERLSHRGQLVDRQSLPRSRLRTYGCTYDPLARAIKALYWDGPSGRSVSMDVLFVEDGETASHRRSLQLRSDLAELAFDMDSRRRFHLLSSTRSGRLYYWKNDAGPWLVASGQDRYFPFVASVGRPFLGYYEYGSGYRFRVFSAWKRDQHLWPAPSPER